MNSLRFGRIAAIILVLWVTFFSGTAIAGCTKDTDCKGNRICENGRCIQSSDSKIKYLTKNQMDREKLIIDLAELKRKKGLTAAGMGVGYGLGAVFLITGASIGSGAELYYIFGGIEMLIGVIATGVYVHYDQKITEIEGKLYSFHWKLGQNNTLISMNICPAQFTMEKNTSAYGMCLYGKF